MMFRRASLAAVLAALLPACAQLPVDGGSTPAAPSAGAPAAVEAPALTEAERALKPEERGRLYYHILLAELAEQRGQYELAQRNYLHAAKASGRPELARSAAVAAERAGDTAGSYQAAQVWAELAPTAVEARELLAIAHLRRGEAEAAAEALRQSLKLVRAAGGNTLRELLRIAETETKPATQALFARLAAELSDPDLSHVAAHLALRLKDWAEAERLAGLTLTLAPERLEALKLRVHALVALRRQADALAAVEAALAGRQQDKAMVQAAGPLLQRLERPERALALYEQFLKQQPEDREVRFALAGLYFERDERAPARAHFERLLLQGPQASLPHYFLGEIARKAGEALRALTHFRQVGGGRFYYEAQVQIAKLLAGTGELAAARAQLHQAASQLPARRLDLLVAEIDLLRDAGELDEARQALGTGLREFPGNVQLLLAQAQIASLEDDFALTRQALEQALGQVDNPELRKQLILAGSEVLRGAGQAEAALGLVNRGLGSLPKDVDLLYARAILAESLDRPEQSEQDLRAILAQQPDNATALNALGYALADRNQRLPEAAELITRALALTPDDPAVIDSMGWLHYRRGELAQALEFLRRAYGLNDDPEIAAHLGEVLWHSGDKAGARTIWHKALDKDPDHRLLKKILERFAP